MDNVVQNISINDIIPSDFHPNNEEKRKIEELAILIKQFGLLDPILVRPKNGKYEIIMGMDKYQAALMANQKMVPVIVKEINDEVYSKYSNIDKSQDKSINDLSTITFSTKEDNKDIINLAELSKIKLEYERDDLKMNNGQFNNEMINNNPNQPEMNQSNQSPAFGGRFFPSLEDEPTNMNMMGGLGEQPTAPIAPPINNNEMNNNLIDLTDLSIEKEPTPMTISSFGVPVIEEDDDDNSGSPMTIPSFGTSIMTPPTEPTTSTLNQTSSPEFNIPDFNANSMPTGNNIINLESLQNNNPAVQPINEPASMEILNADFGTPKTMPNQFDMGPSIVPPMGQQPSINELQNFEQPRFNEPQRFEQPNFGLEPQQPYSPMPNPQPMPNFDVNLNQPVQRDFVIVPPVVTPENNSVSTKDVTPVTTTIKNLANNLASFGFKINVVEEDLPNMSKITIEVEK